MTPWWLRSSKYHAFIAGLMGLFHYACCLAGNRAAGAGHLLRAIPSPHELRRRRMKQPAVLESAEEGRREGRGRGPLRRGYPAVECPPPTAISLEGESDSASRPETEETEPATSCAAHAAYTTG